MNLEISTSVIDFALKGEGELIVIGCALQLGGLSTTPYSIIFIELIIVKFAIAAKERKLPFEVNSPTLQSTIESMDATQVLGIFSYSKFDTQILALT